MLYNLFTHQFRQKLKRLVRASSPREAKVLAVKVSPLFSLTAAAIVLLGLPQYGYPTLVAVFAGALVLGAGLAFVLSEWVLQLLFFLTLEANDRLELPPKRVGDRDGIDG
jgi:hypothetical protein